MKYYFYPDIFTSVISGLFIVLLIYLGFSIDFSSGLVVNNIVFISLVLVFLFCATLAPIYTQVDTQTIIIKSLLRKKVFKRSEVEIEIINKKDIKGSVRLFASGGLFGYIGWFSSSKLGTYYMTTINLKELALITYKNKKYIINFPACIAR